MFISMYSELHLLVLFLLIKKGASKKLAPSYKDWFGGEVISLETNFLFPNPEVSFIHAFFFSISYK